MLLGKSEEFLVSLLEQSLVEKLGTALYLQLKAKQKLVQNSMHTEANVKTNLSPNLCFNWTLHNQIPLCWCSLVAHSKREFPISGAGKNSLHNRCKQHANHRLSCHHLDPGGFGGTTRALREKKQDA